MMLSVMETTSASGNAHHTACIPKDIDKRYASGIRVTSCLHTEVIRLYTPLPMAWNTEPKQIQIPAGRKLRLMILRAGMPSSNISEDALKKDSNVLGANWNRRNPKPIRPSAMAIPKRIVCVIRSGLRAP